MDAGQDVVIVGGGAIGVCCALELARAGAQVTLIERGAELAWGCSAGNSGFICPGHSAPITSLESLELGLRNLLKPNGAFYLKVEPSLAPWLARFVAACRPDRARRGADAMRELATASLKLHASFSEEGLATTFSRFGILVAAETLEGLASLVAEGRANAQAGLRTEELDGAEARSLEPELGSSVVGGVHYPDEAHCDSTSFVEAIATEARDAGATLQIRVEALRLLRSGGRVGGVETTRGRLLADTVVLAAGAWTSQLARGVGGFCPRRRRQGIPRRAP